jgi:hypothetical protein
LLTNHKEIRIVPMVSPHILPTVEWHLQRFEIFVKARKPFTFIRFSDGEIEILRNRKLIIADGVTEFRGKIYPNQFPVFDQKRFEPTKNQDLRQDLLESAMFRETAYFKGIPTKHNDALDDREFMLRLNGGFTNQITFADLFLNANFLVSRSEFFPFLTASFDHLFIIGNWRCTLNGYLQKGCLIQIPDDFFSTYKKTLDSVLGRLQCAPESALILSSASSLSNVLGHRLRVSRPDLTFLDIGTSLNDLLGLPLTTRFYYKLMNPKSIREKLSSVLYKMSKEYRMIW